VPCRTAELGRRKSCFLGGGSSMYSSSSSESEITIGCGIFCFAPTIRFVFVWMMQSVEELTPKLSLD